MWMAVSCGRKLGTEVPANNAECLEARAEHLLAAQAYSAGADALARVAALEAENAKMREVLRSIADGWPKHYTGCACSACKARAALGGAQ